ncbi:MAG TPA: anti-sigma factor [Rhodopila sp.]
MTDPIRPIQEDDLHAYVDDRLEPARRREVETHLQANPDLRRRVEGWHQQAKALREALVFKLHEPVPSSLHLGRLMEQRAARQWGLFSTKWRIAAMLLLTLGLGAGAGWTARGTQRMGEVTRLGREAAAAHSVFTADPTRPIEIGPENRDELVAWIGQKLHHPVNVPDLSAQGYRLVGGRVLSTMIGAAAMLVYDDGHGNRITIFLQPMRSGVAPMQPVNVGEVNGYAWIDSHMGYGVISDGDTSTQALADRVRRAILSQS